MILLLAVLGCGASTPDPAPGADEAAEPHGKAKGKGKADKAKGKADRPEGGADAAYTLVSLQQGDAACYVELRPDGGEPHTYAGAFELCPGGPDDATPLVGRAVRATLGREKVMADSCNGNPECPDTKEVDFVKALQAR